MPKGKKKSRVSSSATATNNATAATNNRAPKAQPTKNTVATASIKSEPIAKSNPFAKLADPSNFSSMAEFKAKNARARELLMSTIQEGSEAWGVAEQYELPYDIWKALEDKYGRKLKDEESNSEDVDDLKTTVDNTVPTPEVANDRCEDASSSESTAAPGFKATEDAQKQEMNKEGNIAADLQRRKDAQARAARALRETMPNRDQRFLWAILHGGKPETEAWLSSAMATTSS